jgi:predicted acyltransferase (DUF342 family)
VFSGAANSVVTGNIYAVGAVSVGVEASVNGDVLTQAAMTLGAKSSMNGSSQAKGAAVVGAGASVIGDFRAASVTVGNSGTISGDVWQKSWLVAILMRNVEKFELRVFTDEIRL